MQVLYNNCCCIRQANIDIQFVHFHAASFFCAGDNGHKNAFRSLYVLVCGKNIEKRLSLGSVWFHTSDNIKQIAMYRNLYLRVKTKKMKFLKKNRYFFA